MALLETNFNELLTRIRHGRDLGPASFEPIYYLVFHPKQILDVKRHLSAWLARLRNEGWEAHRFSIYEEIKDILTGTPLRKLWLLADRKAPLDWKKTNESLTNALAQGALLRRFETLLAGLEGQDNALVLVTDLEALHPYMRIGAIEGKLYGRFHVPTVFLYPGIRTGKTKLKFLGFYADDGNYRSNHIGG